MKKIFLKQISACGLLALTVFSCAGSNEVNDVDLDTQEVAVVEPETNGAILKDNPLATDREAMANVSYEYEDMFEELDDTEQYNVLALIRMNPNLSTFAELIQLSGLAPSLQVAGPITVFAPANEAFNDVTEVQLAYLIDPANRAELVEFINAHVLPSEVSTLALEENSFIDRGREEDVPISVEMSGTVYYVGGAEIVKSNVETSNGMLHVIKDIMETSDFAGADID